VEGSSTRSASSPASSRTPGCRRGSTRSTGNNLARLIKACDGTAFEDRRDLAIVRLFSTAVSADRNSRTFTSTISTSGSGRRPMMLLGWRSRSMLSRYGSSAAAERALEDAHRRTAPGDRL
jgi:hypothetical protein